MRPEISGSSVELLTIQRGQTDSSTTCGSTVPAQANGRGWVGRTCSVTRGHTGLRGPLLPTTFLGRGPGPLVGPMRPEICGCSVGMVLTHWDGWRRSTTYGS